MYRIIIKNNKKNQGGYLSDNTILTDDGMYISFLQIIPMSVKLELEIVTVFSLTKAEAIVNRIHELVKKFEPSNYVNLETEIVKVYLSPDINAKIYNKPYLFKYEKKEKTNG